MISAMALRLVRCFWALLLVSCANHSSQPASVLASHQPPSSASAISSAVPAVPAVSLRDLDVLFGTSDRSAATADVVTGEIPGIEEYRRWVRRHLADPSFYKVLMPALVDGEQANGVVGNTLLQVAQSKSKGAFYYRTVPCPELELQRVRPWWNPAVEVWICRDDYLPKILSDGEISCDTAFSERTRCGCGPNLMFCGTKEIKGKLIDASLEEWRLTLKYVTESDRPLSDLLRMNSTVRSGFADLYYHRVEFFLTGKFVPPDVDRPPSLQPRSALFQGGILSTPGGLFSDGQRAMVAAIWEGYLCAPLISQNVSTHLLLEATRNQPNLRNQSLIGLASTEGCQNCHAKLEYGQRFLAGWQNYHYGSHYVPSVAAETPTARMYVRDHHDLRGEVPATLASLGLMITSQPEFVQCMVERVQNFVYEGNVVPFEVERALVGQFADGQRIGALIESAVVARAFGPAALRVARDPGSLPQPRGE